MKRVKKIFAVLLSLAMVMGMSLTASATGLTSATITVNGADSGAKYSFVQIVQPDQNKTTGWEIIANYQQYFKSSNAFGENADTQVIIKDMINSAKATPGAYQITDFDKKYAQALSNIFASIDDTTVTGDANTKSVSDSSEAGVYFIKIVGSGSGNEAITYSPLTAYVGFDTYTGGAPTVLKDVTVNAKKEKNVVVKTNNDDDNIVSIGDEVTFTIEVKVPYIDWSELEESSVVFKVYDKITGAKYTGLNTNTSSIKMDNATVPGVSFKQGEKTENKDETNTFSVDLSSLVNGKNNQNAGKTVVLTYTAEITAVNEIKNTASAGNETDTDLYGDPVDNPLYTGTIELLKYDADLNSDSSKEPLSGAQFEVYKQGENTPLSFTGSDGAYTWDQKKASTSYTTLDVGTGNNKGKLNVTGLPQGGYVFKEVKAPEGYRIGENPDTPVTLKLAEGTSKASGNLVKNDVTVANSKLSSLPSTGGIGTTIFTVGGCAIMIIAAALFFASRRKSSK